MMEGGEDEDDFGELYWDVLQPFSSQNGTDGKEETCSGNVKCEREEKEALVGSVRLEIYLGGSRRVLENSFVFSLGKKKKNGNHDSEEMVGRDELYPQHVGDSNSEPERDVEIGAEGHHGTGSYDRPVSGSEEGELIIDGAHLQNTRHVETSVTWPRPMVNRYPYLSSTLLFDLDLESLEYRPWRHPNVDLSHYFNYGLGETSWKIYCHQLKSMRIYAGKQIQGEDEPTATVQSVAPECFLQGNNQQQDNNSKRPKLVDAESWSNNEWMCRNDSRFHPIRHHHHHHHHHHHQESIRKSSRKGRSKLERWTRHDQDDNTSTSTSSPPPSQYNAH